MNRLLIVTCLCVSLFATAAYGQQPSDRPLTNEGVIKLVKAGFKEKTVIAIINSRPGIFKLDTEQLIELKRNGVNDNIILAMLSSEAGTSVVSDDDEWTSDESFFRGLNRKTGEGSQNQSNGIFGSSGGSQSQNQTRGVNGGNETEGNTTGSATVRILKPPAEAGGTAAPKLVKTPTLNNEAVIRLVEAGFSEGTIIKRIEESPVDFDLSPGKLDELYKKRVTDPIIAAMAAAMGGKDK
jgi:hypothetical protein